MLRRLLLLLAIAGVAFVVWRVRRVLKARALPRIAPAWRLQAETSPRLAEALDLRDRLARALQKQDRSFQRTFLLEVHALLAEVSEQEQRCAEVQAHLADLAAAPDSAQREETRTALQAHIDRHIREITQVLADLHQVYLELLETNEAGRDGGETATRQTRALIDTLRQQAAAQKEIARFLEKE